MNSAKEILLNIKNKNVLFLQGPMGYYFRRLNTLLKKNKNRVYQIGFNKGDEFFAYKEDYFNFKGDIYEWEKFVGRFLEKYAIDIVFLFGDCRIYHRKAILYCRKNKILVYVFEEGYIRPNYITIEKFGVNKNSSLPRNRSFYDDLDPDIIHVKKEVKRFGNTFIYMAFQASIYYFVSSLFKSEFPNYEHHRNFSSREEFSIGVLNLFRFLLYKFKERGLNKKYKKYYNKQYFLVALQTNSDSQVKFHSSFNSIEQFIKYVLISFSKYAPKEKIIVLKHHPMDRGRADYFAYTKKLSIELGISKRVHIVYDVHLPTLLKNAISTITINSTVGLSSLYHKTPVICLGEAIYNIEGLTAKGYDLNSFWQTSFEIDKVLYYKFRRFLIENTQINDSFYK